MDSRRRSTPSLPHESNNDVTELRIDHLPAVVTLHLAAFPMSALSILGPGAVKRYYQWLLSGTHDSFNVGAFRGNSLLGFCFGGVFRGAMSGYLRKNAFYLASRLLSHPHVLMKSIVRARLSDGVRILRRRRRRRNSEIRLDEGQPRRFGVLSIAVHPSHRRKGVGKLLMEKMEAVAMERGFDEMNLSVDSFNSTAVAFYESLGWHKVKSGDDWHGIMRKTLRSAG